MGRFRHRRQQQIVIHSCPADIAVRRQPDLRMTLPALENVQRFAKQGLCLQWPAGPGFCRDGEGRDGHARPVGRFACLVHLPPLGGIEIRAGFVGFGGVAMSKHAGAWISRCPVKQQCGQAVHLRLGEFIASDEADGQAAVVHPLHMRALPVFWPAGFACAVTADHLMIADPVPAEAEMHFLYLFRADRLVIGRVGTMHHQHLDAVRRKVTLKGYGLCCV